MKRRNFLKGLGAGALAVAAPRVSLAAVGATEFKTELHAALIDKIADEKTIERCAKAGFKGVELTAPFTLEQARQFRKNAEAGGVKIHSIMGAGWSQFNSEDVAVRRASIEKMKDRLRVAAECGAATVLCVPGKIGGMPMPKPSEFVLDWDKRTLRLNSVAATGDYSEYIRQHNNATDLTMRAVEELETVAAECGVTLCLENVWNNLWVKPDYMAALVRAFDSVWVKAYLDLGNHVCYAPVEEWLKAEKGIAAKLHIKDFLLDKAKPHEGTFVPIGKGSIDWKSVRQAIEDVNYNGWISIESGGFTDAEHRKIMDRFFKGEGA